jgi:hypothetical protein
MPVNIQGMVQTIVSLRQLQLSQAAQELARRQQQAQGISAFQNVAQNTADPSSLASLLPQFSQTYGVGQDVLGGILSGTPPAGATTRSAALASGAKQLGGSQDVAAATTELTGMTPGSAARDQLLAHIFGGTGDYYSGLPAESQKTVQSEVLQQIASGQDIGSAAMSSATSDFMGRAPQQVRDRIIEIGRGLAPSASESAQQQLGWANYRLNQRTNEMQLALEDLRTRASLENARQQLDKGAFQEVNNLIDKRSELLQKMSSTSATLTDYGVQSFVDQFNAYNEQLRAAAPQIYGPKGTHALQDLPSGKSVGVRGFAEFLGPYLQGKVR